ncbi:hypothetical protein SAMN03159382_02386 [Pseudomonas sp. NFACC23-1]|uniref:hypothetical protein n=1 Tax=unclassified Pseudomonas TaxID=196821 RepID=UPI000884AF27|nr:MULTISPECIES: hypothetical protein [unclassified Pseudomonas]SDB28190.1 hypothetical protein SAMN03159386_02046 [Pseudomonas sp. NFACC17-2]SEJ41297.1 hypothetical protein SAMN03159382_02386 [Pseudomonas sp. NFACC23-1]SFW66469.1 hypothetical protein SAMN05660640_02594 [Pseudomonas sp. NFACC16-2]
MKRLLIVGVAILLSGMYYIYFSIVGSLAKEDLGPLGDFIGGNINPLLTFISVVLLIDTVVIQRKAVENAQASEVEARKTIKLQSDLATKQSFESSLFNLITLCLNEIKNAHLPLKSGTYTGNQAFGKYLQIFEKLMSSHNKPDILNQLEELSTDALFDNLKNFAMVFKFITDYAADSEKENYISLTLTMMPTSLIALLCIAHHHGQWPILASFETARIFDRDSLKNYLNHYL